MLHATNVLAEVLKGVRLVSAAVSTVTTQSDPKYPPPKTVRVLLLPPVMVAAFHLDATAS